MEKIYQIRTENDVEGRSMKTIGFASGNMEDIEKFYDDQKYYQLRIEPIQVRHVTPESSVERTKLLQTKKELETKLKDIEDLL